MNNNFKELLERFSDEWDSVLGSETLEQLEDAYTNVESSREEILNWVFDNIESDEERNDYFSTFGDFESSLMEESGGVPIFDLEFSIEDSFDEYEGYYQRYGCMTTDYVISWDGENILFEDDDGVVEMIKRPDVLMNEND